MDNVKRGSEVLSSPELEAAKVTKYVHDPVHDTPLTVTPIIGLHANPSMDKLEAMFVDIKCELGKLQDVPSDLQGIKHSINMLIADNAITKSKLKDLEVKVKKHDKVLDSFQKQTAELKYYKEKCIRVESFTRKNNLIISGIQGRPMQVGQQGNKENCISLVQDFLVTKLKLSDARERIKIERAHRLGKGTGSRDMIVKFSFYQERMEVWNKRRLLKGTNMWLREDFPVEIANDRRILQPILRRAMDKGMDAYMMENKLIIAGDLYTVDKLHRLPHDLQLSAGDACKNGVHAFFGRHCVLSNFFPVRLLTDNKEYSSVEQYYQYRKAIECDDIKTAENIITSDDPTFVKKLGNSIPDTKEWDKMKDYVMAAGIREKFVQHDHLKRCLLETDDATLAEANPNDGYWGTGLTLRDHKGMDDQNWPGLNKLGEILSETRRNIRLDL
jgi:ribA/ribD-fused uncharacterized protein